MSIQWASLETDESEKQRTRRALKVVNMQRRGRQRPVDLPWWPLIVVGSIALAAGAYLVILFLDALSDWVRSVVSL